MSNLPLKRILAVDDDEEVVVHLSNILRRANYEVISTTRGKEAVELALNHRPDVIILDIVMPDMGGSEVAAILVGNPSTAHIPIIFLTGILSKQEENFVGVKSGKRYVIAKPVTAEELLALVSRILFCCQ